MRTLVAILFIISISYISGEAPDVYTVNEADGHGYKIMYKSENWQVAKDMCAAQGAKLAVPKSKEQFLLIQKMVRGMHYPDIIGADYRHLVWLGINNIQDYKVWKNIDGENIQDTGFHDWAGSNGDSYSADPREPHCVGIDSVNPGLRDFWCHKSQPYVCEKIITVNNNTTI